MLNHYQRRGDTITKLKQWGKHDRKYDMFDLSTKTHRLHFLFIHASPQPSIKRNTHTQKNNTWKQVDGNTCGVSFLPLANNLWLLVDDSLHLAACRERGIITQQPEGYGNKAN